MQGIHPVLERTSASYRSDDALAITAKGDGRGPDPPVSLVRHLGFPGGHGTQQMVPDSVEPVVLIIGGEGETE